jgi:hypothetical protein
MWREPGSWHVRVGCRAAGAPGTDASGGASPAGSRNRAGSTGSTPPAPRRCRRVRHSEGDRTPGPGRRACRRSRPSRARSGPGGDSAGEPGSSGPGSNGLGPNRPRSDGRGSNGPGSNGPGSNGPGSNGVVTHAGAGGGATADLHPTGTGRGTGSRAGGLPYRVGSRPVPGVAPDLPSLAVMAAAPRDLGARPGHRSGCARLERSPGRARLDFATRRLDRPPAHPVVPAEPAAPGPVRCATSSLGRSGAVTIGVELEPSGRRHRDA